MTELKPKPEGWNFYCKCGRWITSFEEPWQNFECPGVGESWEDCPHGYGGLADYDRGHYALWGENWTTVVLKISLERSRYECEELSERLWAKNWEDAYPVIDGDMHAAMSDDGKLRQLEVLVMMIDVNEANDKEGHISEDIANAKKASEALRDVYCKSVGKELILPWEPNYVIHEGFYFASRRPS